MNNSKTTQIPKCRNSNWPVVQFRSQLQGYTKIVGVGHLPWIFGLCGHPRHPQWI